MMSKVDIFLVVLMVSISWLLCLHVAYSPTRTLSWGQYEGRRALFETKHYRFGSKAGEDEIISIAYKNGDSVIIHDIVNDTYTVK